MQNDECDFNIYFVDVAVDLYDYKKPIKRFINTNFVALKADEYVKMNLDFQTQKFRFVRERPDKLYHGGAGRQG